MIIQVIGTADATSAVRGHCSHRKSQGRNTQSRATTGKIQRLQNIAHSSFPSLPLSNIIGDMAAIDTPNTVKAMLMIVSMASMVFMRRSLPYEGLFAEAGWPTHRRSLGGCDFSLIE